LRPHTSEMGSEMARRTDASTSVTVYSTGAHCQRCRLTCRHLESRGIPFREVDLTDDDNTAAREFVTEDLGYTEAPVVMVDGEPENHWCGFRPDLIDRLAARIAPDQPRDRFASATSHFDSAYLRAGTSGGAGIA